MAPENFEAISRSAKLPSNLEVIRTNRLLISKTKTTLAILFVKQRQAKRQ